MSPLSKQNSEPPPSDIVTHSSDRHAIEIARQETHTEMSNQWQARHPGVTLRECACVKRFPVEKGGPNALSLDPKLEYALVDHIGDFYTSRLPMKVRAASGVYFTPSTLSQWIVDAAAEKSSQFQRKKVLDPACGAGVFLVGVVYKIMMSFDGEEQDLLSHIESHVMGVDLDPFCCWLSQVMIDDVLLTHIASMSSLPRQVVFCEDALDLCEKDKFDVVVGNPPYAKATLSQAHKERFARSVFGHANLYALFLDKALRLTRPNACICLIVPASFLSGLYFKNLRHVIRTGTAVDAVMLLTSRKGVFANVLQETVVVRLLTQKKQREVETKTLSLINGEVVTSPVGMVTLPSALYSPWLLPKTPSDVLLLRQKDVHHLRDYGVKVSTGPLVWNRHKDALHSSYKPGRHPLVWAESITDNGEFSLRYEKRKGRSWITVPALQRAHLILREPAILLKRTSSKEQQKRLSLAILTQDVIDEYGGVVLENHVNYITCPTLDGVQLVGVNTLARLLRSDVVEKLVGCISGSVSVSAYELMHLPLPSVEALLRLSDIQGDQEFERALLRYYKQGRDSVC